MPGAGLGRGLGARRLPTTRPGGRCQGPDSEFEIYPVVLFAQGGCQRSWPCEQCSNAPPRWP